MSKPIIVGYDPATSDREPVNFGVAAARFTGAPLIVASAAAAVHDRPGAGQQDEELVARPPQLRIARPGPVRAVLLGGVSRRLTAEAQWPVIVLSRGVKASLDALMDETSAAPAAG